MKGWILAVALAFVCIVAGPPPVQVAVAVIAVEGVVLALVDRWFA